VVFKNTELVSEYYKNGKSLIAVAGHYGNWEWVALGSSLFLEHKTLGIYKPLTNKFMDEKLKKSREKLGMYMLPNHNVKAEIEGNIGKKPIIIGFVADQTPSNTTKCHWMKFLNQDTPVLLGSEKYAKEFDFPVVFGEIKKIKRGYYELIFHNISSEPLQEDEFAITEKHTRFLENIIKSQPEYWLWTHRRWKHKKPNSFQ
jgi:Kdo2-lipid IVA lauroyltransferase/acyltransferase